MTRRERLCRNISALKDKIARHRNTEDPFYFAQCDLWREEIERHTRELENLGESPAKIDFTDEDIYYVIDIERNKNGQIVQVIDPHTVIANFDDGEKTFNDAQHQLIVEKFNTYYPDEEL